MMENYDYDIGSISAVNSESISNWVVGLPGVSIISKIWAFHKDKEGYQHSRG